MRGDLAGRNLHETWHYDFGSGHINGPVIVRMIRPKKGRTPKDLKDGVNPAARDLRDTGGRLGLRVDSE